ncbi:MAG: hypothetical protein Q8M93_14140 [Polaromonas sp.]|uniref:hypothetical protein n=1 Tax=Polaromonas sp. TaxID=1869339 RepID=UPI0027307E1F|nr:hypothetical protein [Polaromonas sp.]MDP3248091.1 hypothetical protein [Polaromonas sp.]
MDATFGDPRVVSDDSVLDLLDTVRKATAAEVAAQKDLEIERVSKERARAESALAVKDEELSGLKADLELKRTEAIKAASVQRLTDQDKARSCFSTACSVYKWSGAIVGLGLTGLAIAAQLWLPGVLKAAKPGTLVAGFASAWWVPILLFAVPTLLGLYEMPDLVFGTVRRKFADWAFSRLLRWHRVQHVVSEAAWDVREKTLAFPTAAEQMGGGVSAG